LKIFKSSRKDNLVMEIVISLVAKVQNPE